MPGYLALQGLFTAHVTGNFGITWGGLRGGQERSQSNGCAEPV
jgi:uncharacterized membrane protein YoaK (UPF0700 family)